MTTTRHAEALGRPLAALEHAALVEQDRVIERREASLAMWLAQLSAKERRRLGIPEKEGDK